VEDLQARIAAGEKGFDVREALEWKKKGLAQAITAALAEGLIDPSEVYRIERGGPDAEAFLRARHGTLAWRSHTRTDHPPAGRPTTLLPTRVKALSGELIYCLEERERLRLANKATEQTGARLESAIARGVSMNLLSPEECEALQSGPTDRALAMAHRLGIGW
jgi:hypothetical protein